MTRVNLLVPAESAIKVVGAWVDFEAQVHPTKGIPFIIYGVPNPLTPIKVFRGQYFTFSSPSDLSPLTVSYLVAGTRQVFVNPMPAQLFIPGYRDYHYNELVSSPAPIDIPTLGMNQKFELGLTNTGMSKIHVFARIHGITTKDI